MDQDGGAVIYGGVGLPGLYLPSVWSMGEVVLSQRTIGDMWAYPRPPRLSSRFPSEYAGLWLLGAYQKGRRCVSVFASVPEDVRYFGRSPKEIQPSLPPTP